MLLLFLTLSRSKIMCKFVKLISEIKQLWNSSTRIQRSVLQSFSSNYWLWKGYMGKLLMPYFAFFSFHPSAHSTYFTQKILSLWFQDTPELDICSGGSIYRRSQRTHKSSKSYMHILCTHPLFSLCRQGDKNKVKVHGLRSRQKESKL